MPLARPGCGRTAKLWARCGTQAWLLPPPLAPPAAPKALLLPLLEAAAGPPVGVKAPPGDRDERGDDEADEAACSSAPEEREASCSSLRPRKAGWPYPLALFAGM
jgi:hypothetical protein